ncbi:MAG TPA: hypothetical protein VLE73_02450 [Candidatus Saccharimonadales bacterium]|nr:hypothetical protein [Candidatus Saccharimonadales bacterium]
MNRQPIPENYGMQNYTVTFVPEIGRVEVTDAAGQPVGAPGELDPATTDDIAGRLAGISLAFDRSDAPVHVAAQDVLIHPDLHEQPASLAAACTALAAVLPRDAFNYIGTEQTPIALSLGSFSVAERRALPEEIPRNPEDIEREEKIAQLNFGKLDLTTYDHAIVTVDDKKFAIPFDNPDAILLARAIAAVPKAGIDDDMFISFKKLAPLVWGAMPYSERVLYAKKDQQIFGNTSGPIRKRLDALVNRATNRMGVTKRTVLADHYCRLADDISVEYSTMPQDEHNDNIQVLPLDAPAGVAERMRKQQVSAEDLTAAHTALAYMTEGQWFRLGHQQAVDLVEFIMTREGKIALLAAITAANEGPGYTEVYERLHEIARYSLGASYYPTRNTMVIRGGSWTSAKHVRQTGTGPALSTTRADVGVSKWTLLHPPGAPEA